MASPTPHSLGANFSLCHYFGLSASPLAALVGLGTPSTTPTPLPAFFTSAFTHSLSRSLYSKDQRKGKKQPALGWMETGCSQGDQGLNLPGSSCTGLGRPQEPPNQPPEAGVGGWNSRLTSPQWAAQAEECTKFKNRQPLPARSQASGLCCQMGAGRQRPGVGPTSALLPGLEHLAAHATEGLEEPDSSPCSG